MKTVRILEAKDVRQDVPEPFVDDYEEVIAGNPIPAKKAKKQRKKKNDSVCRLVLTQPFYTNCFPDQDANLARCAVDSSR